MSPRTRPRPTIRSVALVAMAAVVVGVSVAACASDDGLEVASQPSGPVPVAAVTTTSTTSTTTSTTTTTVAATTTTTAVPVTSTTTTPPTTAAPTTTTTEPAPLPEVFGSTGVPMTQWPPFIPAGPLDGIAALTGLPAEPEITTRAVLAVKVDNAGPARPQWGLGDADVIIEINVEGITRFMAMYHSRIPGEVGPVRSGRASDLALLAAANRPLLAWSGGNPGVTDEVRHAASSGVLENISALSTNCFRREGSRRAPHNLVLNPLCAYQRAAGAPAQPLWTYDPDWQPPLGLAFGPDSSFDVGMDGARVTWTWDPGSGRYLRSQGGSPHAAAGGARLSFVNVVTLQVPHVPSRIDARSPEALTIGSGAMMLHRDGVATVGTWHRDGPYERFSFRAADGSEMPLRPGTTFVQVARA